MAAAEVFANQAQTTVTTGGTTAPSQGTSETWTVASSAAFPAVSSGVSQFRVCDRALPSEIMLVTIVSGVTWTVTRGAEGTTPVAHAPGFTVFLDLTAGALAKFMQLPATAPVTPWQVLGLSSLSPLTLKWRSLATGQVFHVNDHGADPTGAADSTAAFVAAYAEAAATLSGSAPGGFVAMGNGQYKVNCGNLVAADPRIGLVGPGSNLCTVMAYGSGDTFYHHTAPFSTSNGGSIGLRVSGFTIDGTHTTGTSAGLHIEDICSLPLVDLQIQNFTQGTSTAFTTGNSSGIRVTGNTGWSERMLFLGTRVINCSIHYNFDGTTDPNGGFSCDYMRMLDAYSDIYPGQVGLMVQGFAQLDQPQLNYSYNMNSQAAGAASTAVVIGPTDPNTETSRIINALFDIRGEMDGSGSTCYDLHIGAWAQLTGTGVLVNTGSMTAGAINSGSVYVAGYISTPAFPSSHLLFSTPGNGSIPSFAAYTGLYPAPPAGKGFQLLDWTGSAVRSTLIGGTGNPTGSGYYSNLAGDLFIRQDGTANNRIYQAPANGSNAWVPVVAAAVASGTVALTAGAATVANTSITANSVIRTSNVTAGGTVGALSVTKAAGTSFTIHSTSGSDTSTVFWEVVQY